MYKVQWHNTESEGFNTFMTESEAKHFAIDSAYEGYQCYIYECFLGSKKIYRTEKISNCFAVLPV